MKPMTATILNKGQDAPARIHIPALDITESTDFPAGKTVYVEAYRLGNLALIVGLINYQGSNVLDCYLWGLSVRAIASGNFVGQKFRRATDEERKEYIKFPAQLGMFSEIASVLYRQEAMTVGINDAAK